MRHFFSSLTTLQKILAVLVFFLLIFILGANLYLWQVNQANKPQQLTRAIEEYRAVNKNLKDILPEEAILSRTQEGEKWISRLEKVKEDFSSGKKEGAKKELLQLKSRIEFISESNERRGYNLDQNKDGVSDYAEGLYQEILTILREL